MGFQIYLLNHQLIINNNEFSFTYVFKLILYLYPRLKLVIYKENKFMFHMNEKKNIFHS